MMDDTQSMYTAMAEYEKLYVSLQPSMDKLKRLKEMIKTLVLQVGRTCSHGATTATYRKGYVRVSWDGKGLDGYAVANPEVLHFRKESKVESTVSISVKGT